MIALASTFERQIDETFTDWKRPIEEGAELVRITVVSHRVVTTKVYTHSGEENCPRCR